MNNKNTILNKELLKLRKDKRINIIKEYTIQEICDIFKENRIQFVFSRKSVDIKNISAKEKELRNKFWGFFEKHWIKFVDIMMIYFYNLDNVDKCKDYFKKDELELFKIFEITFLMDMLEEYKQNLQLIQSQKKIDLSKKEKVIMELLLSMVKAYWYKQVVNFLNLKVIKEYKKDIKYNIR